MWLRVKVRLGVKVGVRVLDRVPTSLEISADSYLLLTTYYLLGADFVGDLRGQLLTTYLYSPLTTHYLLGADLVRDLGGELVGDVAA